MAILYSMKTAESREVRFSIPSIIAIVTALLSFTTGAFWGIILAVIAMCFGLLGLVLSLSPSVRGGLMSILSLVAASIGLVAGIIKAVGAIL